MTCEAHEVCANNDNAGDIQCKCGVTIFVTILRGDRYEGYEYAYSTEPFADVCSVSTELPRCPNCGHEFGDEELHPDASRKDIFKDVQWDPTEHDYDKTKEAVVTCPHCSGDFLIRMFPPKRPTPEYSTFRQIERACETCGETHDFSICKMTRDGVLLRDAKTDHVQEVKTEPE